MGHLLRTHARVSPDVEALEDDFVEVALEGQTVEEELLVLL